MALSHRTKKALVFLGLAVGCMAKFASGSLFVFNVYQNALKATYNYTQSEVELLSSFMNLGLGFGWLPGLIYDRWGPTVTSVAGLLVTTAAYCCVWVSARFPIFFHHAVALLVLLFFIGGLGSTFTYMAALNTNVMNFAEQHRGKIIGLLNGFFAGSPTVFALVYYRSFSWGDPADVSSQDYPGFMLFLAVLMTVVNSLCILCLHRYNLVPETDQSPETNSAQQTTCMEAIRMKFASKDTAPIVSSNTLNESEPVCNSNASINQDPADVSEATNAQQTDEATNAQQTDEATNAQTEGVKKEKEEETVTYSPGPGDVAFGQMLRSADFYLLLVSFTLATASGLVFVNNITVTSLSAGLSQYDQGLVIIIPIVNTIVSIAIGAFSDVLAARVPRSTFFALGVVAMAAGSIFFVVLTTTYWALVVATILTGFAVGTLWSLTPALVSEQFGLAAFGRNWGILMLTSGLTAMAGQAAFGAFYDRVTPPGQLTCLGGNCVRYGYIVMAVASVIALVLAAVLDIRHRRKGPL